MDLGPPVASMFVWVLTFFSGLGFVMLEGCGFDDNNTVWLVKTICNEASYENYSEGSKGTYLMLKNIPQVFKYSEKGNKFSARKAKIIFIRNT